VNFLKVAGQTSLQSINQFPVFVVSWW